MENDLKIIKRKYGEKMMHYCREEFSTILEKNGLLSKLLLDHFEESHILYDDIVKEDKLNEFKNYIYSLIDVENNMKINSNKTPYELLSEAGYNLYECKTESDIQSFKRFYSKGEELCTFRGNRLEKCYVFFAVKKDVEKIKREDFLNPKRQDEYGTSVISIQFTRHDNTLSIKNRYNHTVNNPDATFSNNLDNIIEGLTQSFNKYYRFNVKNNSSDFELRNYVCVADKFYKYNYEIDNIYYCPNNIIIDNFEVKKYDKEKYILFDYFLLDLKEKKLYANMNDSFVDAIRDIDEINIVKKENEKEIHLIPNNGEEIIITLDNQNRIIKYINNNILECGDRFLKFNEVLQEIELKNLTIGGALFLYSNKILQELSLPSLVKCGDSFLYLNNALQKVELPSLVECGNDFLFFNKSLQELNLPNLVKCGDSFLYLNDALQKVELPSLVECGDSFLHGKEILQELSLPSLVECGNDFLFFNKSLQELNLPNLVKCGDSFLYRNEILQELSLPNLVKCGDDFLKRNKSLQEIELPKLKECGNEIIKAKISNKGKALTLSL